MPTPAIELKDVWFSYDASTLEEVTLKIDPLESVCIVGPNGGGKTTLVKLILGLLEPQRGSVLVFGKPPREALLRLGYVPQYSQYDPQFPVTVVDVVLMGRLGHQLGGAFSKDDRQAAISALEEVHLADLAARNFSDISGGQRQRVLIARALATAADILILDEPTAHVDIIAESDFHKILDKLNQRMTVLLVTHDVGFVNPVFQNVVCVNRNVVTHPTTNLTGEMIQDLYGGDIRLIRHDHACQGKEHECY